VEGEEVDTACPRPLAESVRRHCCSIRPSWGTPELYTMFLSVTSVHQMLIGFQKYGLGGIVE